jgi:hypothetical protein
MVHMNSHLQLYTLKADFDPLRFSYFKLLENPFRPANEPSKPRIAVSRSRLGDPAARIGWLGGASLQLGLGSADPSRANR